MEEGGEGAVVGEVFGGYFGHGWGGRGGLWWWMVVLVGLIIDTCPRSLLKIIRRGREGFDAVLIRMSRLLGVVVEVGVEGWHGWEYEVLFFWY